MTSVIPFLCVRQVFVCSEKKRKKQCAAGCEFTFGVEKKHESVKKKTRQYVLGSKRSSKKKEILTFEIKSFFLDVFSQHKHLKQLKLRKRRRRRSQRAP